MRLIDADALLEWMAKRFDDLVIEYGSRDSYASGFDEGIMAVEDSPTIDAVEVVRCGECKYWAEGDCYRLELSRSDDYCSYGERRSEDD